MNLLTDMRCHGREREGQGEPTDPRSLVETYLYPSCSFSPNSSELGDTTSVKTTPQFTIGGSFANSVRPIHAANGYYKEQKKTHGLDYGIEYGKGNKLSTTVNRINKCK